MMENNYYIYLHIKLDTGEPFYVGKGCNKRAYIKRRRGEFWWNIVNKHDYDIIFLEKNLTEEESFEKEKYWINRIGRKDLGKGPLINFTDGGEGLSGYKHSTETIKKFSKNKKGEDNPFYGKKHSEETREKIRESRKKQVFTQKTRKKMSESRKGGKSPNAKKVININTNTIFNSLKEASEFYDINYSTLRKWLNPKNINKSDLKYL